MSKVMIIAWSCEWWTLPASSSVKVMACSSAPLVLGGHPESWTFCTAFKYVFLDLEDCPTKVPPTITLISPSGSRDGSSTFPFNFSSLWSRPRKFLNFPYLIRFSIYCFKSKHLSVSCSCSLWKRCERPRQVPLKKEGFGYLLGHLSFWVTSVESPPFFIPKKKKIKNKYMTELFHSLIE